MNKVLMVGLIFLIFALTAEMPRALAAEPPTLPWPPEPEWHPMSPESARPQMRRIPILRKAKDYYLEQGESFFLAYGWSFAPTNKAYDLTTGQPETIPYPNLQDRTDSANAHYTVTMNGQPIEPTDSFTGTCKWGRTEYPTGSGHWMVIPRTILRMYYIVFPDGLPLGEYTIRTYVQPVNPQVYPEPFSFTAILHVESTHVGLYWRFGRQILQ